MASFIDAHPHMIMAYEYKLFYKHLQVSNKRSLFNELYQNSHRQATDGWTSGKPTFKNYSLHVDYPWQGKYDRHISVIGDKAGGTTAAAYIKSPKEFVQDYTRLKEIVDIPVKSVFVVRNPFDIISTRVLYHSTDDLLELLKKTLQSGKLPSGKILPESSRLEAEVVSAYKLTMITLSQGKLFSSVMYDNITRLEVVARTIARMSNANAKLIEVIEPKNVLIIHNEDLVDNPKSAMERMCKFLEVDCPPDYVQACADKVYKSVLRTRNFVVWPPRLQMMVEKEIIERHQFFARYTFESD